MRRALYWHAPWRRAHRGDLRCRSATFRPASRCVPCYGFVRVRCDERGLDRVVAFSCKGPGFCSSGG